MSFLAELEQLQMKKVDLTDELHSICREEKALKQKLKVLKEKLEHNKN